MLAGMTEDQIKIQEVCTHVLTYVCLGAVLVYPGSMCTYVYMYIHTYVCTLTVYMYTQHVLYNIVSCCV